MPIDLNATESYLFTFIDRGQTFAVSVPGRDEAEARHRFATMTAGEKRGRIVARLSRQDRDVVADLLAWAGSLVRRRPVGRTA